MVKKNPLFSKLTPHYLFHELALKKEAFQKENPHAKVISLSIGDTSMPVPRTVSEALKGAAETLATDDGYSGYGPEGGDPRLRAAIASELYGRRVGPDEVFVSDGAKCDIGRLQLLFGREATVAVQDPTYPVYVDSSVLVGQRRVVTMPCIPEVGFFPDAFPKADLIFFCSPNNPTGNAATREQLATLVAQAKRMGAIVIFDSAYAGFIQDPTFPRSIYEIEGAKEVAIEVSSFSKLIGFTGVRLGWTVVPKELRYEDGQRVHDDWVRLISTLFNGASNLAQAGGLAALTPEGQREIETLTGYYMENARILRKALETKCPVFGGEHAPYLWAQLPTRYDLLSKCHLVVTPGEGFGECGKGFIRLSAFGKRTDIEEAAWRLERLC